MATEAVHGNGRRATILVADDERSMREMLAIVLQREGHRVLLAEGGRAAVDLLKREPVDLLVSDIRMPDMSGVDVLRAAKQADPEVIGIMITAFASTESAVEALRLGAHDYLSKPFDVSELKVKVHEALEHRRLKEENAVLKKALIGAGDFANILGDSPAIRELKDRIHRVAPTNSTILVTGESGTGKELVARAIHANSTRRSRPFVAVNCGALPETLLESELFGHLRGSFTGADSNKKGLVEVADHGTILLDEIGEMPPVMQVKLLRVLQERKFRRVGATRESSANIRVIAATNQDLATMVAEGTFREDLFYRINVIGIHIPPFAGAARGCAALGRAGRREVQCPDRQDAARAHGGCHEDARALFVARQRARARERHRTGGCLRGGRRRQSRKSRPRAGTAGQRQTVEAVSRSGPGCSHRRPPAVGGLRPR